MLQEPAQELFYRQGHGTARTVMRVVLPTKGFLITMIGGAHGHAPGRVVEFDKNLQLVKEYPN
jgi:hypothetical protein